MLTVHCGVWWTDGDRESDGDLDGDGGTVCLLEGAEEFKASCAKEMALLDLMEKTGYNMVQENGQRKYGGPPPGVWTQPENSLYFWMTSFKSLLVFINGLMDYLKSRIFCQWISWLIASVLTRGLWYLWRIRLTEILPDKMPERLMGNFRDVFIEGTKKKHKIPVSVSGGQSGLIRLIRRGERNVCQPAHTSVFVFTNHRNRMWETLIQFTVQWWMMIKVIWWKILLHLRD